MKLALIADDEPELLEIFKSFMEDIGFRVILARNGDEVFSLLSEELIPDVFLCDINMPKFSLKILEDKILKSNSCPQEIIIMTGDVDPQLIDRLPGQITLLSKPFSFKQLERACARSPGKSKVV